MPRSSLLAALASIALVVTMSADVSAEPAAEPPELKSAGPTQLQITLITGDQVSVLTKPGRPGRASQVDRVIFRPSPSSGSSSALITRAGGHTVVIPSAVVDDMAAGRLDRALFDVTTLITEQYDDGHSPTLPVILRYTGSAATARARAAAAKPAGVSKSRLLRSIGGRSAAVTKKAAGQFWASTSTTDRRVNPEIASIHLDRRVKATIDHSVPQIGAPTAWQRGFTGQGVKVAVLDTGIDSGHPDLAGKVAAEQNFTDEPDTGDRVGHGTHVAGTIAGSGAASEGHYRGVAPDATLLNGKVLGEYGGLSSWIIAGMEWATGQGAKVVNLSLGGAPTDGTDPLSQALNTLSRQTGTLFVVAAGNCDFPGPQQVAAPASADEALAVANLERDGTTNFSSCRGPRRGDFSLKPEIAAPGTDIVAARAAGTDIGPPVGEHYTTLTGTSMATPHVAGTAALLAQAEPGWTGEQLYNRLVSTADAQPGNDLTEQGAGRVDADQATDNSVTVDIGELEFGYLKWPPTGRQPITRTLTYRNSGSTPVTLDLAAGLEGSGPTPSISPARLVVPAGGQAAASITADPTAGSYGAYRGRITASPAGGGDPLVTTFGWYLEDERYDVTIHGTGLDGTPAEALLLISRPDGGPMTGLSPEGTPMIDGRATVRVPPGVIDVSSFFVQPDTDTEIATFSLVTAPEVRVSGDTSVTLDARRAAEVRTAVRDKDGLTSREQSLTYLRRTAQGDPSASYQGLAVGPPVRFFAVPTEPVTVGQMEFDAGARLEVPPFRARSLGTGGEAIPVADVTWAPRFTGVRDLTAVDAGTGSPEDLAGDRVRGKLALIRHDPEVSFVDEILLRAQDAGAAAVVLYNPAAPGLAAAAGFAEVPGLTMPTMRTSRVGAGGLLELMAQRPVAVRITGVAATPDVYDLLEAWPGAVPQAPRYVVRQDELARLDETFGTHARGMPMTENRFGLTPLGGSIGSGEFSTPVATPYRRTSYLSAAPIAWDGFVVANNGGEGGGSMYSEVMRAYSAGNRQTVGWFVPVANSGLPDSDRYWTEVSRSEGFFSACFSPLDNSPHHFEAVADGTHLLTLKRNGEPLGSIDSHCAYTEVSDEPADYEISLDVERERPWWQYSTRVQSTWTVRSQGGAEAERLPVILADLAVPSASDLNQVKVGKSTQITLALRHQHSSSPSAFTAQRLELSYDGEHWQELPLSRLAAGRFTTTVTHPADQAGQGVHLRLDVADENGGRLRQEITRAYGLSN